MLMARIQRISKGGQVSVPATVRKRWATASVLLEDHGEALVLRPAPADPIAAAAGAFADLAGPALDAVRREDRELEAEREDQHYRS